MLSRKRAYTRMEKEKIVTILILIGLFGGLVGGPVASLVDYYAPPERRFWVFIIPEFVGFGCLILLVIYGKSRKPANA
jgi:uncharacterized membrane protein YeaQ/YmgE (transglycosylase-associated protein family)